VAALFCWFTILLLIACAALTFTRRRALSSWLLVMFPAAFCFALLFDISHGVAKLGLASYHSDLRALPYVLAFLAVTLLGALRPNWRWLFWLIWLFSALLCGVIVYLTFFWKVFS
jgi:hypothetical protein